MTVDNTRLQNSLFTCENPNTAKSPKPQPSVFSFQPFTWTTIVVLLCLAPLATTQLQAETLLTDLADQDFAIRERASEDLLADDLLNSHKIIKLYAQAHLPEQQHRLLDAALHHAIRRMRLEAFKQDGSGAIGIRHEAFSATQFPGLDQAGLIVVETFPGFPGHARLRRGDLILAIDGQQFASNLSPDQVADRFVRMVQNHQAGKKIELAVHRDRRTISVEMRLASLNALRAMYKNAQNLQKPYLDRWLSIRQTILESPSKTQSITISLPQTVSATEMPHPPTDRSDTHDDTK